MSTRQIKSQKEQDLTSRHAHAGLELLVRNSNYGKVTMKLCVNHKTNEFYSHPVSDGTKCPLCNQPAWLCLMPSDKAGLESCDYRFCESPTCEWENI